jgi:hypothetical protein
MLCSMTFEMASYILGCSAGADRMAAPCPGVRSLSTPLLPLSFTTAPKFSAARSAEQDQLDKRVTGPTFEIARTS